jgi:hypothetical protein
MVALVCDIKKSKFIKSLQSVWCSLLPIQDDFVAGSVTFPGSQDRCDRTSPMGCLTFFSVRSPTNAMLIPFLFSTFRNTDAECKSRHL